MKKFKEFMPYVIIIIMVVLFRTFIATPVKVDGASMDPYLKNNDVLILNKMNHHPKRFDVVALTYNGTRLVKRIIALPGETLEYKNNKLYINGVKIDEPFLRGAKTGNFKLKYLGATKVPKDYYFVLGDNRENSMDSRMIGFISNQDILGKIVFRLYPFSKIGVV